MKSPLISINKTTAFTLIEVLISLAIISLAAGLSLVGWQTYARYLTATEFNNIESSIRAARTNAIHGLPNANYGDIIFDPTGNTTATTVSMTINNQTHQLYLSAIGGIFSTKP